MAARNLEYVPNLLARGLAQDRTSTIGVLIHELSNPFFSPIVSEIERVAATRDYLVIVGESRAQESLECRYLERFQQLCVAGILVDPASLDMEHLGRVRERGTPVVALARRWAAGDYVAVDNLHGGMLAARHLLSRGHRRIALVRCPDPENTPVQERTRAFQRALAVAGRPLPRAGDIHTPGVSFDDGRTAADQLMRLPVRPTAVFAVTDRLAIGLIHGLQERGLAVPQDVVVVGYDDIPMATYGRVPLTTVAIPIRRIGELAAQILFDRLRPRSSRATRRITLKPTLVVRGSSP